MVMLSAAVIVPVLAVDPVGPNNQAMTPVNGRMLSDAVYWT
jgi:hypothetical protein